MANEIIPQDLIIYRRILTDALAKITNEMYASNNKIGFRTSFTLIPSKEKPSVFINSHKPLYLFRVYVVDKSRNPIGEEIYLYNNYYPKDIEVSLHKLERTAIQDYLTNGCKALYNYMQEDYMAELKAKQDLIDSRAAQGITLENVQAEVQQKEKDFIRNREQDIMKMMHPDIK